MTTTKNILTELKEARENEGISQTELGRRIDIPQSHISKIEKGGVDIQLSSLEQIARGLGYEVRLVPKNLLSSVDVQIKSARETRKDRTRQALKTISNAAASLNVLPSDATTKQENEIADLNYDLKQLKELQYTQTDLDRLTKIISTIIQPSGFIESEESGPKSREVLVRISNQLRALRGELADKSDLDVNRDIPVYSMVEKD